ncbi:putative ubiquinone biosynthesis monooxygenase, variant 2 [Entomophthora muscae]|nr:putative ubiquinone biosynthesis monooxygenase, variant 2 [Entomophthora muscae]
MKKITQLGCSNSRYALSSFLGGALRIGRPVVFLRASLFNKKTSGSLYDHRGFATEAADIRRISRDIEERDVVIVGGGVVGLALACKIVHGASLLKSAAHNPKITIIERFPLAKPNVGPNDSPKAYANRVVSLTPASAEFLQEIGVWEHLDLTRVRPYKQIHVWDAVGGGMLNFDTPADVGNMAYMVELNNLSGAFMAKLQGTGIELLDNTSVTAIHHSQSEDVLDWPQIGLDGGQLLRSRLLVGADGANSPVRMFAGIESMGWDYHQHGVVGTLTVTTNGAECAWQRFLPTGTFALLPLDATHSSMVWSLPPEFADKVRKLPLEQLGSLIQAALTASSEDVEFLLNQVKAGTLVTDDLDLGWRRPHPTPEGLPSITSVLPGSIAAFPLRLRHVNRYVVSRVALVGDAAHTIHPLAGQGLNLGLADAKSLGSHLSRGLLGGSDIGSLTLLQGYASERYWPNLAMLGATDKINRLFRAVDPILPTLRSFGFNLLEKHLPASLKNAAVRIATKGWPL